MPAYSAKSFGSKVKNNLEMVIKWNKNDIISFNSWFFL